MLPELKPPDKSPPLKQTPATSVQVVAAKAGWDARRSTPDVAADTSHSNCPALLPICPATVVRVSPESTKPEPETGQEQKPGLRRTALLSFHRPCCATQGPLSKVMNAEHALMMVVERAYRQTSNNYLTRQRRSETCRLHPAK